MLVKFTGDNVKGLTFEQSLERLNLIVGPNGSGKSARMDAVHLLVNGAVPGKAKKLGDIVTAYGGNDGFKITGNINGIEFGRKFGVTPQGRHTQTFGLNGKTSQSKAWLKKAGEVGMPAIFDLSAFHELSGQKQLDEIFSMFPPGEGLDKILEEIDSKKEEINQKSKLVRDKEAAIKQLRVAKNDIEVESTLPEINAEIEKYQAQIKAAQKLITQAEERKLQADLKKAEDEAKAKQSEEDQEKERDKVRLAFRTKSERHEASRPTVAESPGPGIGASKQSARDPIDSEVDSQMMINAHVIAVKIYTESAFMFANVQETMKKTGCDTCVASMLIKKHLKVLKEKIEIASGERMKF